MKRTDIEDVVKQIYFPAFIVMYGEECNIYGYDVYHRDSLFHTQKSESPKETIEILEEFFNRYDGNTVDVRFITSNCSIYDNEDALHESCF